jgi:hypothetical protein
VPEWLGKPSEQRRMKIPKYNSRYLYLGSVLNLEDHDLSSHTVGKPLQIKAVGRYHTD